MKRTLALFHARNLEFFRDRSSLAWNILFPLLIILGFAFTFSGDGKPEYKVGVIEPSLQGAFTPFLNLHHIDFVPYTDRQLAIDKLNHHQLDLVVDNGDGHDWLNDTSSKGYLAEKVMLGAVSEPVVKGEMSSTPPRYIDWFMPGILGMNMMFSGLYGVGYVIVRYRKNGVLKRLKATPVTAMEFLVAQLLSRLAIIVTLSALIFTGCYWLLQLQVAGSFWTLLLVALLGGVSMVSLGLLTSSVTRSEELASGLLNFISWPMMFLSGVWFSLEGTPQLVQWVAQIMPLTHVISAAREVILNGASLMDIGGELLTILLMALICLFIGAWRFRWD